MRSKQLVWGIVVILTMAVVLGSCTDAEEPEYGELIINNLPPILSDTVNNGQDEKYWGVIIFYDTAITGREQMLEWMIGNNPNNCVAYSKKHDGSLSDLSPFSLRDYNGHGEGFLQSGTYLVHIQPERREERNYRAVMSGVVFKNGKARINFSDMMRWDDLPK